MSRPRTVVVTGSASGMGAATAALLGAAGQQVIGVDRHDADVIADLGTAAGRTAAIEHVGKLGDGVVDGLVTFAGVGPRADISNEELLSCDYFGTVELVAGLQDALVGGDAAAAVVISSHAATIHDDVDGELLAVLLAGDEAGAHAAARGLEIKACYNTVKLAVARWARLRAAGPAWAGAGITLNVVAPGYIVTPMTEGMQAADPAIAEALRRIEMPIGRHGRPSDIAELVVFLLGPGARFISGSFIVSDGGVEALRRGADWPAAPVR